jgi:xylan 1,4-beta-xylosidase
MSYWTFSDIFEEMHSVQDNVNVRSPFHNAYGLISVDGIPKPSFRAFELLGRMPNATLPVRSMTPLTHDNWVSLVAGVPDRRSRKMELMLVSFAPAPSWGAVETWNVSISVTDLFIVGNVGVVINALVYRVDETHANAWAEWKRMGSPGRAHVNASVIAALNASSVLVGEPQECRVGAGANASVELSVSMPKIGLAVVELHWSTAKVEDGGGE